MANLVDLPSGLNIRHQNFRLDAMTGSAGRGLDGRRQVLSSENRVWMGRLTFPMMDAEVAQLAEVVGDQLGGRAGVLRLPVQNAVAPRFDGDLPTYYASLGVTPAQITAGGIAFSDGSTYSDGTLYKLPGYLEPVVGDAREAGATLLRFEGFIGRNLRPGALFSIDDFLYRVASNSDGFVTFNPPLRAAVAKGAGVAVSSPFVRMRLQADDGWQPQVSYGAWAEEFSAEFEEVFER